MGKLTFREKIYRNTFSIHHWVITKRAFDIFKEHLEGHGFDYLSIENILHYQEEKFKNIKDKIKYHYTHPFHYKMMYENYSLHKLSVTGDLVTNKEDLRRNQNFHIDKGAYKITTSGSTGEPLTIYANREQLEMRMASTFKNLTSTGYRFGDRTVRLWHTTIGMSMTHALKERIDAWFCNRVFFPIFKLDDDIVLKYISYLYNFKPVLIDGYAEAFNLFARVMIKHKDNNFVRKFLKEFKFKVMVTSAQTLTDEVREFWENNFGCKVYDKYGSREFSGIAFQCEHGSYHVNNELYYVDTIPIENTDFSEIYITDLYNTCTPMIRYKIGDVTDRIFKYDRRGSCPCGRSTRVIGKPQGRLQAIIYGLNDTYLVGTFFAHYMKDFEHSIKFFQFIQNKEDEVEFYYIPIEKDYLGYIAEIIRNVSRRLGGIKIKPKRVEDIKMVRTGKMTHSICNLDKFKKGLKL